MKLFNNQENNNPTLVEGVRKVLFMGAFAAHPQLSLAFVHNILQKLLIIRAINFAKGASRTARTALTIFYF